VVTTAIVGAGTGEVRWREWLGEFVIPPLDPTAARGRRIVVLAAHPDDEVLGVGGLLTTLSRLGHRLTMVWASDGEASHPASTVIDPGGMAARRRAEAIAGLARLGITPDATHRLGLPDGGLADRTRELAAALGGIVEPDDLLLAPWSGDGHPDHEAVGQVAGRLRAAAVWEYPIWMWHWAEPGDARVPWPRARSAAIPDLAAKRSAIAEHVTQVEPLGELPGDAPILPPAVVERFLRRDEVVFT